eukprot:NODE_2030_length_1003_cov_125.101677_g1655_i0.p1 GENE.NODE_2030_length_1003_cov_125.101677_g1655_i0~~NODE_2030_length_1003_cov_125.101677_g1655_i0.p1  ORF type:complete len:317 (-),score=74.05 NODE_2030_length_1003_cov_125.101677_g1655_i0:51-977(-)
MGGLSIAKEMVGLWNGEIRGTSAGAGHGSTFSFTCPVDLERNSEPNGQSHETSYTVVLVDSWQSRAEAESQLLMCCGSVRVVAEPCDAREMLPGANLMVAVLDSDSLSPGNPMVDMVLEASAAITTLCLVTQQDLERTTVLGLQCLVRPITLSQLCDFLARAPRLGELALLESVADSISEEAVVSGVALVRHALVADDISINQMVIRAMLSKYGFTCDVANDGFEAVVMVDRNRYDVVFMDYHMPNMDGCDATRMIRNTGHTVPIIALTGAATASDREMCTAAGMSHFLPKPVTQETLREALIGVGLL